MADIIAEFDINSFGRATPKFSPDELMQINARVLQQLDFSVVNGRLSDAGLGSVDEGFWLAVRGNITTLTEVADWWAVCHQPVVPEIEDPDLLAVALEKLPEGPFGHWPNGPSGSFSNATASSCLLYTSPSPRDS